jgi:glutathione S-transferase
MYLVLLVSTKSFITVYTRLREQVLPAAEDWAASGIKRPKQRIFNDAVERTRRAHRNDLENVLPFIPLIFLVAFAGVPLDALRFWSSWFASLRTVHPFAYLSGISTVRGLCFSFAWVAGYDLMISTYLQL